MDGRREGRTDGTFQSKMVSQKEYSSTKYSVNEDDTVQNNQSVETFQHMYSQ